MSYVAHFRLMRRSSRVVFLGGYASACTSYFSFTLSPCFLASCELFAAYSPLSVLDAVNRRSRHEDGEKAGKGRGM